jgi:hypothetical protein
MKELSRVFSRESIIRAMDLREPKSSSWTLLTGHGHVLVEIARNTRARIRDSAASAGLTERAVQAIIADLEAAGYLTRTRAGRRTVYTVHVDRPFRHPRPGRAPRRPVPRAAGSVRRRRCRRVLAPAGGTAAASRGLSGWPAAGLSRRM